MSAGADSRSNVGAGVLSHDWRNRTQYYGVSRHSFTNTPDIRSQSDNVSTVRLADSDSESLGESDRAGLPSTPAPLPPSSPPVLEVERFIEETARIRRARTS